MIDFDTSKHEQFWKPSKEKAPSPTRLKKSGYLDLRILRMMVNLHTFPWWMFILLASTNRVPRCWISVAWIGHGSLTMAFGGEVHGKDFRPKGKYPKKSDWFLLGESNWCFWGSIFIVGHIAVSPIFGLTSTHFEIFNGRGYHAVLALLFRGTLKTENWPPASTQ